MQRTPIKIHKVPITFLSELGYSKFGGTMTFCRPIDQEPPRVEEITGRKNNGFERVLWCPYCGEWTIFEKEYDIIEDGTKRHSKGSTARWICQGSCHWWHTDDFEVKRQNNLWLEGLTATQIKNMKI